jgi:hypothetical protein
LSGFGTVSAAFRKYFRVCEKRALKEIFEYICEEGKEG